ncbi:hypothetical protein [Paractinoplanes toevensis]|uniref:Lipoprotein n=1 Tax=Paractinoplanes toevensis TaxID=571911 RepID=A0A920BRF7_9ACTN|nr:hypothetical protein [Actinoplanes toevensis]GIM98083.1 hypothetical protein Ato02nite_098760 [Actinoplanes toevensis]
MVGTRRRLRLACAALLVAVLTAGCDTKSQFEPSLPPEAGFRVDGGVLKLWTGTPCAGVIGLTLVFDSGTKQSTQQVWTAPQPGVLLERMDLLASTGGSVPDTAGPLQVQTPLPAGYDWTKAGSIVLYVNGPTSYGATADVAQVLRESAQHPSSDYLFGKSGWLDASGVQRENTKSFLTICTPDPNP